jgi:hypothetical protein
LRNVIQRIRERRHPAPQPQPSPAPPPPIPPVLPPPQPVPGLTAIVFEDVGKRQPWQAVVDKFAEDSLRDKDGTSHYRRYDLSVLDKPDTPTSIQGYWQLVKDKPLPQMVIEYSGKRLFAGAEPQTVADFQTLLRQCQPAKSMQDRSVPQASRLPPAAGTAAPPCARVCVRARLPLFHLFRKARRP